MFYSCRKDFSEAGVVPKDAIIQIAEDTVFFSYRNQENELKNRIIAALKQRDEQQCGVVRQNAAPYGQPMWDASLSSTIDSMTRILVPMADIVAKKVMAVWGFDCRMGSDTVHNGIAIAPPALEDTTYYDWDVNMLYDYFRFRLGFPAERKVKFSEDSSDTNSGQGDIQQNAIYSYTSCNQICWSFDLEHIDWEWDNAPLSISQNNESGDVACKWSCTVSYFVTFDNSDIFLIDGGGGGGTPPTRYTVTVTANPLQGGSVSGSGTFDKGTLCTVNAVASAGYEFTGWTGSVTLSSKSYSFTLDGNKTFVANFKDTTPCGKLSDKDQKFRNTAVTLRSKATSDTLETLYMRKTGNIFLTHLLWVQRKDT